MAKGAKAFTTIASHFVRPHEIVWSGAFMATVYNKIFLGYVVLRGASAPLRTRTEMVLEMLVFSPLNLLTWLVTREDFITHEIVCTFRFLITEDVQSIDRKERLCLIVWNASNPPSAAMCLSSFVIVSLVK
jgi:hypothetical protein